VGVKLPPGSNLDSSDYISVTFEKKDKIISTGEKSLRLGLNGEADCSFNETLIVNSTLYRDSAGVYKVQIILESVFLLEEYPSEISNRIKFIYKGKNWEIKCKASQKRHRRFKARQGCLQISRSSSNQAELSCRQ
jgi:hypothetical protein